MRKIILILVIFLLCGCADYNELNRMDLISSIIVDKKDDNYEVHLEVLDTSKDAKKGSHFVSGQGENLEEALTNAYKQSRFTPFYAHMSAFVISESVAEDNIKIFFDYLLRDTDFRKGFLFFVTEDVDSILEYSPEKNKSFGLTASQLAENIMEKNGLYKTSKFREIIYHYLRGNTYYIGGINVIDKNVTIGKTYLFDDNKLIFNVDEDAALFTNILYEKNEIFQIKDDNTYIVHEHSLKRDIKRDKITLKLSGSVRLLDIKDDNVLNQNDLKKLEEKLNEYIEEHFMDIIKYAKRKNKDIFNFNYFYYMYYPRNYKDDIWKNIEYEVKSDLKIREKGMLLEAIEGGIDG